MTTPPSGSGNNNNGNWNLPQLPGDDNYKAQFHINMDQWRGYWQKLFKNQELTDIQVQRMTDQFVNYVWNQMNQVLQHALQNLKDLEQQRKDDENS